MKLRFAALIVGLELILILPAWAQAPAQPAPARAVPEEPRPVLAVPEGYRYEPNGRRDPFVNPIPKPPAPVAAPVAPKVVRPPGLKGALVGEIGVLGVYISKNDAQMTRAVLQIPGMRAPLLVSRGDRLFDASIKEIRPDGVLFSRVSTADAPVNASEPRELLKTVRSAGDKK